MSFEDTICAISTPKGLGGISVIRVSGRDSLLLLKKIFTPLPISIDTHKVYYGNIFNNFTNEIIDEVITFFMKAPKSFTREDVVEIQCHGGYLTAAKIIDTLLKNGCRLADAGEFTKRAFLNGRIDLTQAEAVADIINSKSDELLKISEQQLKGSLKSKIDDLKNSLINILSNIESSIDFDEYAGDVDLQFLSSELSSVQNKIEKLTLSYDTTKSLFEGIKIVIAGMPNSGKSSLLNYFLKKDRAIISEIPGTTRDTIEEDILVDGIIVKVIDTAGLRETDDTIEKMGIERSLEKIAEADIVIYLVDMVKGVSDYDKVMIDRLSSKKKKFLVVGNKSDIAEKFESSDLIKVSIKERINLECIEKEIRRLLTAENDLKQFDVFVTNLRHYNLLKDAKKFINMVNFENQSLDMVAFNINQGINLLGQITGEVTSEDILDNIFRNFCIGK